MSSKLTLLGVAVTALIMTSMMNVSSALASASPQKIVVTGAGGKTGRLVMKQLLDKSDMFDPIGVVRTQESFDTMVKEYGIPSEKLIIADICNEQDMKSVCDGKDGLIICTSATPAPTGEMTPEGRPKFGFPFGQPEQVDWLGQKYQIDSAKAGGMKHVVICSSMGGTNPENPLNKLGRSEDGKTGGNILLWKRKAEMYLIESGLTYTIVHPGGLLDEDGGKRELVVGVNDEQLGTDNRSIPRADVASVLVASLQYDSYKNRSFDVRSKPVGEGTITTDYDQLLLDMKANCDYKLGVTM